MDAVDSSDQLVVARAVLSINYLLQQLSLTVEELRKSGISKVVSQLRKHSEPLLSDLAKEIRKGWMDSFQREVEREREMEREKQRQREGESGSGREGKDSKCEGDLERPEGAKSTCDLVVTFPDSTAAMAVETREEMIAGGQQQVVSSATGVPVDSIDALKETEHRSDAVFSFSFARGLKELYASTLYDSGGMVAQGLCRIRAVCLLREALPVFAAAHRLEDCAFSVHYKQDERFDAYLACINRLAFGLVQIPWLAPVRAALLREFGDLDEYREILSPILSMTHSSRFHTLESGLSIQDIRSLCENEKKFCARFSS